MVSLAFDFAPIESDYRKFLPTSFTPLISYPYLLDFMDFAFGGSVASLTARHGPDPSNLPSFTPGGVAPSYPDDFSVSLPAYPNGISIVEIADAAEMTEIIIARRTAAAINSVVFGTGPGSSSNGHLVWWNDDSPGPVLLNVRTKGVASDALFTPGDIGENDLFCLAITHRTTGRTTILYGDPTVRNDAGAKTPFSGHHPSLGNVYLNSGSYSSAGPVVARYALKMEGMSAEDLQARMLEIIGYEEARSGETIVPWAS